MLDYKLVQALALVVREGGFEKAAKVLHLTQSAVSQRVKSLEDQTGQVLLVRSSPPRATVAGQEMLKHFRRVERLEGDLAGAMRASDQHQGLDSLPIGLNADSLATWFLDAVRPFVRERGVLLDLTVDDQEQTHKLLRRGEVVGCVSSRADSVQGCQVSPLGRMVYRLLAAPAFAAKWFGQGVTPAACGLAPAVIFNHRDDMHNAMLKQAFGAVPKELPAHFVPSSEKFVEMIVAGLGYGMVPEYQGAAYLRSGALTDLGPEFAVPVELYWHCWDIGSPLLEAFTAALKEHAWMVLATDDEPMEVPAAREAGQSVEASDADPAEPTTDRSDENLFGPG